MIRQIDIRNVALIEELSLDFSSGFSILTGETGAGKSILINAIGLLLGERASTDAIRSGADEAEVCGVFDLTGMKPGLRKILAECAIEPDENQLIVRRKISRNATGKTLVNQSPVPVSVLKKIGDALVDLHGQHDHQSLLDEETHRQVIDDLPDVREPKNAYDAAYAAYAQMKAAMESFDRKAAALSERREILEFQLKELSDLNLKPGEEEKLQSTLDLLSSAADRAAAVSEILALIGSSQDSIEKRIAGVRRKLELLAKHDDSASPWISDVGNALSVITELETFCGSYLSRIGHSDAARLEQLNGRLAKIQRLRKKFSCDYEGLIAKREAVARDLAAIENVDADRAELAKKLDGAMAACRKAGVSLSTARSNAARNFDRKVSTFMASLGFSGGEWRTQFSSSDNPQPHGLESIRFLVRTNPGEPLLPLAKTASGGEISRLMLAIKSVMSAHDQIPILIFDEIDTGIGGMLAKSVGEALASLSKTHQVFCITHLHQIASLADHHFHVFKEKAGDRTVTRVEYLTEGKRVDEVARMLGGDSAIARRHAKELLKNV